MMNSLMGWQLGKTHPSVLESLCAFPHETQDQKLAQQVPRIPTPCTCGVQGYLAHKKTPSPIGP